MSFSLTSSHVDIAGSKLEAWCRTPDGLEQLSILDLDSHLGNNHGTFDLTSTARGFSKSASRIIYKNGIVEATLYGRFGGGHVASICLDLFVCNVGGELKFTRVTQGEYILVSCGMFSLEGSVLSALCLGNDGKYHQSSIDLNKHYGTRNGFLTSGRNGFYAGARNVSFEVMDTRALLCAEVSNQDGEYIYSEVDISLCVFNHSGRLVFERHDGSFDCDGQVTKLLEKLPLAGFAVAGIQASKGDEEWAKRAMGLCTARPTITIGVFLGCLVGGAAGGAISSALASPLGNAAEVLPKSTTKDDTLKAELEKVIIGRALYGTLRVLLDSGTAGHLAAYLARISQDAVTEMASDLSKTVGKPVTTGTVLTVVDLYDLFVSIAIALSDVKAETDLQERWWGTMEKIRVATVLDHEGFT
ncbi:hypothetical protein DENSPDRAFT_845794 [Dentipellis sp. KUC8613]|nr:hypothetical protein DENSPDRAFT_845794 [Dentipellis sp. KUC8613]